MGCDLSFLFVVFVVFVCVCGCCAFVGMCWFYVKRFLFFESFLLVLFRGF